MRIAADGGYDFELLKGVIAVNDEQQRRVVEKVELAAGGELDATVVAVWGLTFKAGTDDLRSSPSLAICEQLVARGAKVRAYDPTVERLDAPAVDLVRDAGSACDGAAVLVVLTEWDEFRWIDLADAGRRMARRAVVDTRSVLDRAALRRAGFVYYGIGRT